MDSYQTDLFGQKNLAENNKEIRFKGTYLFFDTETTGLPLSWSAPQSDLSNWPRLVQIAWSLYQDEKEVSNKNYIIKPEGFLIPENVFHVHGITNEKALSEGKNLTEVLIEFQKVLLMSDFLVAHNISFDEKIMGAEFLRKGMKNVISFANKICTQKATANFCQIPSSKPSGEYKWPKLSELHFKLFGENFENSHNAFFDVQATAKCFWELKTRGIL